MDSDYKLFEPEGKSKNKNQDEKTRKKKNTHQDITNL